VLSDDKGIVWPENVAPFRIHLVEIGGGNEKVKDYADELYQGLKDHGTEVLYDDRDVSAGEKFADADLLGIPIKAVTSEKTGNKIEIKKRSEEEVKLLEVDELIKLVTGNQ